MSPAAPRHFGHPWYDLEQVFGPGWVIQTLTLWAEPYDRGSSRPDVVWAERHVSALVSGIGHEQRPAISFRVRMDDQPYLPGAPRDGAWILDDADRILFAAADPGTGRAETLFVDSKDFRYLDVALVSTKERLLMSGDERRTQSVTFVGGR